MRRSAHLQSSFIYWKPPLWYCPDQRARGRLLSSQSTHEFSSKYVPPVVTSFIDNKFIDVTLPTTSTSSSSEKIQGIENGDNCFFYNRAPSTGKPLCRVQIPTESDINNAISSSKAAHSEWSALSSSQRGEILHNAAMALSQEANDLVQLEALDSGIPITQIRTGHVPYAIQTLRYYASLATSGLGRMGTTLDTPDAGGHSESFCYTRRESLGICLGIGPWNYPLVSMMWKLGPALSCGNTLVYKPSECTPLTALRVAQIFAHCGLPPGVLNVLPGGRETAVKLVEHDGISKVSLTGSTDSGIDVARRSALGLKKLTLELGGKSPLVIFDDADLESAVNVAIMGNFANNGQVCSNCTRVYVENSLLDAFLKEMVSRLSDNNVIVMGDNMMEGTNIGPLIMPPWNVSGHFDRVKGYIDRAVADPRATLVCGGNFIEPPSKGTGGYYIEPTIFKCETDEIEIVQEEIFGPVMTLLGFDTEEEVIVRANGSRYGLAAGVMTRDLTKAHRVAKRLEAGNIWINNWNLSPVEMPFGPYKMSGYGKEGGQHAIEQYTQIKNVYVEMGDVHLSDTYFAPSLETSTE